MVKNKRKSLRRKMCYTAWVAIEGGKMHGCVLSDISETGARIDIDQSKAIPDNFTLLLASNGSARRKCCVVWRKPMQIGVTFDQGLAVGERATLVPKLDADTGAASAEPAESTKPA